MKSSQAFFVFWGVIAALVSSVGSSRADDGGNGNGPGNGGSAVLIDGQYYLYDLVEAGIERTATLPDARSAPEGVRASSDLAKRIRHFFLRREFPADLQNALVAKVSEMPELLALKFMVAFDLYQWNFLRLKLKEVKITDTVVDTANLKFFQAAVRHNGVVTLNLNILEKMNLANQTALILHEVFFGAIRPTPVGFFEWYEQSSRAARGQVANQFRAHAYERRAPWTYFHQNGPSLTFFPEMAADDHNYGGAFDAQHSDQQEEVMMAASVNGRYVLNVRPLVILNYSLAKESGRNFVTVKLFDTDPHWVRRACARVRPGAAAVQVYTAHRQIFARLRSYSTEHGENQYVDFSTTIVNGQNYGGNGGDGNFESVGLKWKNAQDCERDLPAAVAKVTAWIPSPR